MKEINIKELIKELESLNSKGILKVELIGTLICVNDGNKIIYSTQKQF
jgi:hypothetical protein